MACRQSLLERSLWHRSFSVRNKSASWLNHVPAHFDTVIRHDIDSALPNKRSTLHRSQGCKINHSCNEPAKRPQSSQWQFAPNAMRWFSSSPAQATTAAIALKWRFYCANIFETSVVFVGKADQLPTDAANAYQRFTEAGGTTPSFYPG